MDEKGTIDPLDLAMAAMRRAYKATSKEHAEHRFFEAEAWAMVSIAQTLKGAFGPRVEIAEDHANRLRDELAESGFGRVDLPEP